MDGSHPTDQERAKVAEERVKPKEKVAQTPPQQPDLAQKGGEQIQKTSEVRTLPGNGFLFLMETDAETGAKFWRYSMDRSKPCWTWRGGMAEVGSYRTPDEAEIICEVPNRISLTDDKLARSLVTKALKMEASKCGLTSPIHIMLVPESYQVTVDKHGFPSFKPVQVDGRYRCDYHFGGYSSSPSKGKVFSGKCDLTNYNNIALAKEQVKLEAKQAASISELGPQKAAEALLAQKITKCGNSHYTKDLDPGGYPLGLYEFKDLSIKITASPLTEADKLNGIEWKGTVILVAKASRPFKAEGFERKPAWQAWENGAKIDHQNISGSLAKRKGRWHLELQIGVMRVNLKPIKCSEISSGS